MTEPDNSESSRGEQERDRTASSSAPSIHSEQLLRGGRELQIVHGAETYRLLLTRNNKLILQK